METHSKAHRSMVSSVSMIKTMSMKMYRKKTGLKGNGFIALFCNRPGCSWFIYLWWSVHGSCTLYIIYDMNRKFGLEMPAIIPDLRAIYHSKPPSVSGINRKEKEIQNAHESKSWVLILKHWTPFQSWIFVMFCLLKPRGFYSFSHYILTLSKKKKRK